MDDPYAPPAARGNSLTGAAWTSRRSLDVVALRRRPWSGGFLVWGCGAPIPRQQFWQSGESQVRHSGKDNGEPNLRVDVVHLCGDDKGIHEGGAFAATVGTREEPCFAAEGRVAQGSFGGIVGEADAARKACRAECGCRPRGRSCAASQKGVEAGERRVGDGNVAWQRRLPRD